MALIEEPLDEISSNQSWHGMLKLTSHLLDAARAPTEAELTTAVDCCYSATHNARDEQQNGNVPTTATLPPAETDRFLKSQAT